MANRDIQEYDDDKTFVRGQTFYTILFCSVSCSVNSYAPWIVFLFGSFSFFRKKKKNKTAVTSAGLRSSAAAQAVKSS